MNAVTHYMTIDLLRETVDGTVFIRNAGIGHRMCVRLTAGSRVLTLPEDDEGIVQLVYKLPDGTKSDVQMTADYGDAWVMIPRAMLSMTGVVDCEVRVYLEELGTWTTSPQFTVTVQDVIYDEDAQEEIVSDPTVYETILASETTRGNNETTRQNQETTRQNQETARQNAEAARVLAENARVAAEAARVLAEEARAAAEEARIAGGAITRADVDSALSGTSVNPVQNKAIKAALDAKFNTADIQTSITTGLYPVTSKAIKTALDGKQAALTFDDTPTQDSNNPVTSGGIYTALQNGASVVQGLFTPDPAMEYASWLESEVRQVGSMVHMYLEVNKGSAFGSNEVTLGTFSGVGVPQRATIVTVCLTDKLNGGFHYGMAKIKNNGTVKLICSEPTDDCAYINVSYQAATS